MIEFKNVSFSYDAASSNGTIHDINFHIKDGEFVAIIGANGAGKSTISKLINGLLKPNSGDVFIDSDNTKKVPISVLAKKIGFLFQNPDRQICCDTIEKELSFGLKLFGFSDAEISKRVAPVIEDFGFDKMTDPFSISRGERQRVALASIIVLSPKIIILDEPTTGLDYAECMHIMKKISELNKSGVTVIMVCHDMELVLDFAQRTMVISNGKIVADGKTREIFRKENILKSASILPPQIIELSMRLDDDFKNCTTVNEMIGAIKERNKDYERIS